MAQGKTGAPAKKTGVTPKVETATTRRAGVTRRGVTPKTIGKAGLCEALGWTRPRLDRRLDSDGSFPVVQRGTRAGGWEFDLAAVVAYLDPPSKAKPAAVAQKEEAPAASEPAATPPGAAQYPGAKYSVVPPAGTEPVVHSGEQTARQRRDMVQAEILEDKLRRDRGELVQVEVMRQVLNTMLAHLGKGIDRLSEQVVEKLDLPEENIETIRIITDDLRKTMADELKVLLG